MTIPEVTLEERVAALEAANRRLDSSVATLKRGQRETRAQVRNLEKLVEGLPGKFEAQLATQTNEVRVIVAESETRTADKVIKVARQWTAPALIAVTSVTIGLVILFLHALGVIHVHVHG